MQIQLPQKVQYIITQLEQSGFEAYAVGGCVRDSLLGREPDDWDVTTSAKPLQVKAVFRHTIDTGIQHGTVTVMLDHEGFEVTTYRIDGEYEDSRHPKEVIFTANLVEDLKRRDFTINAMAYNDRSGIVDVFGGMDDLDKGIIRCVGEASERFSEDALRMLRAVRFSAQLGFSIAEDTKAAIRELAPSLQRISAERIQTELVKLLMSKHPDYMRDAYQLGITKIILPELDAAFETAQNNPHHKYPVGEHLMHCLLHVRADKSLRIAALLHDIGKPATKTTDEEGIDHFHGHVEAGEKMAAQILKRLKFDNDTITKVRKYVQYHDYNVEPNARAVRRAVNKIGEDSFSQVMELRRADTLAQSSYQQEEKLARLDEVERLYAQILEKQQCLSLKNLAVSGNDLMALGVPKGRAVGEMLNRLLEEVLQNPENNTQEYLTEYVRNTVMDNSTDLSGWTQNKESR
ncbi:MAG: CCA tRNA nucleotidyltransferase [Lachnospiraceae bacterium]|nr:CCA tRNA nucleotidyltransferase [Lachnospiraceae bacterium]